MLATFLVTSSADTGPNTLRQAIQNANTNPGADEIRFNIGGGGLQTIQLSSALPDITDTVTLDGISQPGAACNTWAIGNNANLLIQLSGPGGGSMHGLVLRGANSVVRGLVVNGFYFGIAIAGPLATGNRVECNFIGTDFTGTGTAALPNVDGVFIVGGASQNTLGGATAAARNLISGNQWGGVGIADPGTSGNVVQGNYCGTNAAGTAAVPNGRDGVILFNDATNNFIGGTTVETRNVLSGNNRWGVGVGTAGNVVEGNFVGTTADGGAALGNADIGVLVTAPDNRIGGTAPGAGNLISANQSHGIYIAGTINNTVQGNVIGTDVSGSRRLGNRGDGVHITGGASNNTVGGPAAGAGNLISANQSGVGINGSNGNVVQGNVIGSDSTGALPLGNTGGGVELRNGASNNRVGGALPEHFNFIAYNFDYGVAIFDTGSTGNVVQGNFIMFHGVGVLIARAMNNSIGGTGSGEGNTIAWNGEGVLVDVGIWNAIRGNTITGHDLYGLGIQLTNGGNNHNQPPAVLAADSVARTITIDTGLFMGAYTNIDYFENTSCHPSGRGEGERYLGSRTFAQGIWVASFPAGWFGPGSFITATATDPDGNTSEFSSCALSTGPGSPSSGAAGRAATPVEAMAPTRAAITAGVGALVPPARKDDRCVALLMVLSDPHAGTATGDEALPTRLGRKPVVSGLNAFGSFVQAERWEELAAALFAAEELPAGL